MTTRQVPTKNATYRTKQFKSVSYLPHFLFVNLLLMGWQQNIFDTYLPRRKSFVVSSVGSNEQIFQNKCILNQSGFYKENQHSQIGN